MTDKRNINPGDTFVLDDDELEELEKLSLSGVIRDATGVVKQIEEESTEADEIVDGLDSLDLGYLNSDD